MRQWTVALVALAILLASTVWGASPQTVEAIPPLPARFTGTVLVNGENVPDGTIVSAHIDGVEYARAPVDNSGPQSRYALNVPGDDPDTPEKEGGVSGDIIIFKIDDNEADQTGIWRSGSVEQLNLTTTAQVTPTHTPTRTPTATSTPTATVTGAPPISTPTSTPASIATPTLTPTMQPDKCSITGNVFLQGRPNHSGARIRINGTPMTTTAGSGRFTVVNLNSGDYVVTASHPGHLTSEDNSVECHADQVTEMPETTLLGGDANNDKRVNLFDLVLVGVAYNTCSGDPGFASRADINETGCVDIFDLVLVGTNYGRTGPTNWPTTMTTGPVTAGIRDHHDYQPDLEWPSTRMLAEAAWWDLQVVNVHSMYGVDVTITFDPTLIKVIDADPKHAGVQIMPGPLFAERKFFIAKNLVTVDEAANIGTIRFAATLLNPAASIDADGIVATIPVELIGDPTSTTPANLSIKDALLAGKHGRPLLIKQADNTTYHHLDDGQPSLSVIAR